MPEYNFRVRSFTDGDMDHDDIVEWVWRNRIPKGRVTLISGAGGGGKTHVIASVITYVLQGKEFPDGEVPEVSPGNVMYLTTEQKMTEIRGIHRAQGCTHEDFEHLHQMGDIVETTTKNVTFFDLDHHQQALRKLLTDFKPIILVIDPLIEFHSKRDIDAHQIRSLMVMLDSLAEQYEVTIIATIHWNKNDKQSSSNRSSGSHQYRDSVRSMITVETGKDGEAPRRFHQDKHNLGPAPVPLTFTIERPLGKVTWEIGATDYDDETRTEVQRAEKWLVDHLTPGPMSIQEALQTSGFSERTLHRARAQMRGSIIMNKSKNPDGTYDTTWDITCARNNWGAGKLRIGT